MKVTDTSQIQALAPTKPEPVRALSKERAAGDRVSTTDSDKITRAVQQASQAASSGRSARLQAIENAVRAGMYRPDPARIAQQILDDAELAARLQALFSK